MAPFAASLQSAFFGTAAFLFRLHTYNSCDSTFLSEELDGVNSFGVARPNEDADLNERIASAQL